MQATQPAILPDGLRGSSVLSVGFGTTVAMWAVGYLGRLPAIVVPSPVLLFLLLACVTGGGFVLGRYTRLDWRYGAAAGAVSGLLNLLVLGSFLTDGEQGVAPSAWLWLPGSIVLAAGLAAVGSLAGSKWFRRAEPYLEWPAAFVRVDIAAALLLLAVGGLVTSTGAGLAVVDWPNTFGYNMFLYPFSRMTGGIYYEHAHRLFGALVGLTTLVLAVLLQRRDPRRWVRGLGWGLLALVVAQGVMGGLRVTGDFTLSTAVEDMRPNLVLAMVHGIVGQLFLCILVFLGVVTSTAWRRGPWRRTSPADGVLGPTLLALLLCQLVLGAVQRHLGQMLLAHILVGVAFVAPLCLHVGFRAWLGSGRRVLERLGLGLIVAVAAQVLLGFAAYTTTGLEQAGTISTGVEVAVTTAHQWFGAVLLALAVAVVSLALRRPGLSGGSK